MTDTDLEIFYLFIKEVGLKVCHAMVQLIPMLTQGRDYLQNTGLTESKNIYWARSMGKEFEVGLTRWDVHITTYCTKYEVVSTTERYRTSAAPGWWRVRDFRRILAAFYKGLGGRI